MAARSWKFGQETRLLLTRVEELVDAIATAGNATPEIQSAVDEIMKQAEVVDELVPDES